MLLLNKHLIENSKSLWYLEEINWVLSLEMVELHSIDLFLLSGLLYRTFLSSLFLAIHEVARGATVVEGR